MGWELRRGRWYLYRNLRVHGKPTKMYLAAQGDFGSVMAYELANGQDREHEGRDRGRKTAALERASTNGVLAAAEGAHEKIRIVAEAILVALGFHNHHRGEWRMTRGTKDLGTLMAGLQDSPKKPGPLINYEAPACDVEAVELFAKARAGDAGAVTAVRRLIVERKWVELIGNLGTQAGRQLVASGTAGDAVWKTAIDEKMLSLWRELDGGSASMLEKLLIQRVLNNWAAVHLLEIRQTVRPPAEIREREYLDRAVSRAQKRYTEAITALARVRRMKLPLLLARLDDIGRPAGAGSAEPRKALAVQDG